jgi:two-component system response regulator HydG
MRAAELRIDDLLDIPPTGGVIRFGGNRTLLLDAVALGLLRTQLIETLGLSAARGLLTRLGYSHGVRTAESLRDAIAWDDEAEWRIAGGRLHRLQGLVSFEPVAEPADPPALAQAVWRDSYEAEQHVLHLGQADEPVCWTLCGFASGYLSRVTGQAVYAVEERCCGRGDPVCRMVARTHQQWGDAIEPHLQYYERDCLDASLRALRDSLRTLESRLRSRRRQLGAEADALAHDGIVARSHAMRRVLELAVRIAGVDSTVLLTGESGVGKERIARFIHARSERTAGPFVAINCGALPDTLLESELFGHAKGAFTGATRDRAGLFEAAHGGTLLLDEIGEVPPALQVRLLRVLQEREVRRLGENHDRHVDVRVIAATHRDLAAEVAAGRFREDLYYRLGVLSLAIPPLRERLDDVLPLARLKLLETAARFQRDVRGFTPAAARRLLACAWPGNVRELHNAIERAVVFAEGDRIDAADLPEPTRPSGGPTPGGVASPPVAPSPASPGAGAVSPVGITEGETLEAVERAHILAVLEAAGGNRAEAARRLGIGSATLFRKLKRYGIPGPRG